MTDSDIINEAIRLVAEGVCVTLPVNGNSMLPFIVGGRESVVLQKPVHVKVGDIVLAWVVPGRWVVHRIISIDDANVTLMGDGNLMGTEHCTPSDIKAKATHVVDGKEKMHYLYTKRRKLAAILWFKLRMVRKYLLAIYRRL